MEINVLLIKELRERTGIGMLECKKALLMTNGDIELAAEELRKKGLIKAVSKANRQVSEGGIKIVIEGHKAYVVSVCCETDFLAKSDRYQVLLTDIINFLKSGKTVDEAKIMIDKEYSLEMGENLQIKDFIIIEGTKIGAYVHSNNKLAAVVIAKKDIDEEKLKQVAMHVTATNPDFLSINDIPIEVIEKERRIQLEIMKSDQRNAGKPDEVLLKIIEGKIGKFISEISLLEQQFVIDPNIKVKDFIGEDSLSSFYRFNI